MNRQILKQAQQLQARMARVQEELGSLTVEASSGGGMVKVVVNGHQQVQSVNIAPESVNPEDVEMLQDMVLAAVNDALEKSQKLAQEKLGAIAGGLQIPGLF